LIRDFPTSQDLIQIGRKVSDEEGVCLNSEYVSSIHTMIIQVHAQYFLIDTSRNGTWLGKEKLGVGKLYPLSHKEKIRVADYVIQFLNDNASPPFEANLPEFSASDQKNLVGIFKNLYEKSPTLSLEARRNAVIHAVDVAFDELNLPKIRSEKKPPLPPKPPRRAAPSRHYQTHVSGDQIESLLDLVLGFILEESHTISHFREEFQPATVIRCNAQHPFPLHIRTSEDLKAYLFDIKDESQRKQRMETLNQVVRGLKSQSEAFLKGYYSCIDTGLKEFLEKYYEPSRLKETLNSIEKIGFIFLKGNLDNLFVNLIDQRSTTIERNIFRHAFWKGYYETILQKEKEDGC